MPSIDREKSLEQLQAELRELMKSQGEESTIPETEIEGVISGHIPTILKHIQIRVHDTADVWKQLANRLDSAHVQSQLASLQTSEIVPDEILSSLQQKYDQEFGKPWETVVTFLYGGLSVNYPQLLPIWHSADDFTPEQASQPFRMANRLDMVYQAAQELNTQST